MKKAKKNKDPHYVAKIEKAISDKYGVETIQNPKSNWGPEKEKEYLEQIEKLAHKEFETEGKVEKVLKDGILISRKLINKKSNRQCPICKTYSFSKQDDLYMNKFECCIKCYIQYVEDREERWKKGWRPSNEINKTNS